MVTNKADEWLQKTIAENPIGTTEEGIKNVSKDVHREISGDFQKNETDVGENSEKLKLLINKLQKGKKIKFISEVTSLINEVILVETDIENKGEYYEAESYSHGRDYVEDGSKLEEASSATYHINDLIKLDTIDDVNKFIQKNSLGLLKNLKIYESEEQLLGVYDGSEWTNVKSEEIISEILEKNKYKLI